MLTNQQIEDTLAEHKKHGDPSDNFCKHCYKDWPCVSHKVLTDLLATREGLRKIANSCDDPDLVNYAHTLLEGESK